MESWYKLQGIPDKDSDTTWLEYLLNFLGEEQEECPDVSGVSAHLNGPPCISTMQDI